MGPVRSLPPMPRPPATPSPGHRGHRTNWLRAAVLGANDGIVSTAGLVLGVVASGAGSTAILTAAIAGLVAGALSMAAGEYVSVSSQRDVERADLELERRELATDPAGELAELAAIYERRGLPPRLAQEVAATLSADDALAAHVRDELGIEDDRRARPLQAATSSAVAFSLGALLPILAAELAPQSARTAAIVAVSLLALVLLGAAGARLGGAPRAPAALRVLGWGAAAMAITYAIGALVGTAV